MPTLEYPDPVVARFIAEVRSIPARSDEAGRTSRRRAIGTRHGWLQRAVVVTLLALQSAVLRFIVASSTWTVRSREAARTYRSLMRELRRAGWSLQEQVAVTHALFAIRHREVGEPAVRIYESAMEARIPRQSLGWS